MDTNEYDEMMMNEQENEMKEKKKNEIKNKWNVYAVCFPSN